MQKKKQETKKPNKRAGLHLLTHPEPGAIVMRANAQKHSHHNYGVDRNIQTINSRLRKKTTAARLNVDVAAASISIASPKELKRQNRSEKTAL